MKAKALSPEEQQAVLVQQKNKAPGVGIDPTNMALLEKMRGEAQKVKEDSPKPIDVRICNEESIKEHSLILADGREIVMGPPGGITMLIIPEMFKHIKERTLVTEMHMVYAEVFQYVRSISGQKLPKYLSTWEEVADLMHQLGDLGTKAVKEHYEIFWGQGLGNYWNVVEKKPQDGTLEK